MMNRFLIFFFVASQICCNPVFSDVYKFHLSDAWYPSSGKHLERKLSALQQESLQKVAQKFDSKKIKAIIVPHAGYDYSGVLASSVYQNIVPGTFDRVIILGPSHHSAFDGIGLPGSEYLWYKSPLGHIQLDGKIIQRLQKRSPLFVRRHQVHELEHSIEVQIPFIQKYCGTCKIIPLLVGSLTMSQIGMVADILEEFLGKKTLLIVSSDFVHCGTTFNYAPFHANVVDNILKLDEKLIEQICMGNALGFLDVLQTSSAPICGKNALMILLDMMQKKYLGDVGGYLIGHECCSAEQNYCENYVSYVGMIIV